MSSGCAPRKSTLFPKKFMLSLIQNRVSPHRKGSKRLDLHGGSMETEAFIREVFERTHMLADGDGSAEQDRMCRACAICCVIDVVGIDSHKRCAGISQELCRLSCEKRMTLEVLICAPVTRPSGMD